MVPKKRVKDEDYPSLRDDDYAERQYWLRRISWNEYYEVKQFQEIYNEFWQRKILKVRDRLGKHTTDDQLFLFIDN